MKWLLEISGSEIGGNETCLWKVFRGLKKEIQGLILVNSSASLQQFYSSIVTDTDIPVNRVDDWVSMFKKHSPDAVVTTTSNYQLLAASKKLGIPSVWCLGGPIRQLGEVGQLLRSLCLTLSDFVYTPGRWQVEELAVPSSVRFRQIEHGIDTDSFKRMSDHKISEIRGALGIPVDAFIIANSARLEPGKRHKDLLLMFEDLRDDIPNSYLLFLARTQGPKAELLWKELWTRVLSMGIEDRVRFFSALPKDVPALLSVADVFVFPSLYEGCPNAVLEAMALEIPVAVADCPGTREPLNIGNCGYLFEPENPLEMSKLVKKIFENPDRSRKMGILQRNIVKKHYSYEAMLQNFHVFFREVCASHMGIGSLM